MTPILTKNIHPVDNTQLHACVPQGLPAEQENHFILQGL